MAGKCCDLYNYVYFLNISREKVNFGACDLVIFLDSNIVIGNFQLMHDTSKLQSCLS